MDCGPAGTAACVICAEVSFNAGAKQMDCQAIPFGLFTRTLTVCCGLEPMMRAWVGLKTGVLLDIQLVKDCLITGYFRPWKIRNTTSGSAAIGGSIESVSKS